MLRVYLMVRELIIQSTGLTKAYGSHIALDSLDIKIEHGSTGLLGPNGAGKSTFLKTILGLIQLTSGEGEEQGEVRPINAQDAYLILEAASSVLIVP